MTQKNTSLPWVARGKCIQRNPSNSVEYPVAYMADVIPDEEARANAELIVRAVNSHDELVKACSRVLRSLEWSYTEDRLTSEEQAKILRDAIAQAGGEV